MKTQYCVALILLATALTVTAAPKPPAKKPAPAELPADQPQFSSDQLDYATDNLPPNYGGHSCVAASKAIQSANPIKGEYETTAAFDTRTAGLPTTPAFGAITFGDYFAFVKDKPTVSTTYNADTAILKAKFFQLSPDIKSGSSYTQSIIVALKLINSSSYEASNAYGKSVSVKKIENYACAVALQNYSFLSRTNFRVVDVDIPLQPDDAKAAKDDLSIMFVGKLAAPYWLKFGHYMKATIDSPTEIFSSGDAVSIKLMQIWIFNKRTGQVYKKIDT